MYSYRFRVLLWLRQACCLRVACHQKTLAAASLDFSCERVLLRAVALAYLLCARLGVTMSVITQESTSGESCAQVQEVLVR